MTTLSFATDHCFYERSGDYDTLMVLFNYWGQEVSVRSHGRYNVAVQQTVPSLRQERLVPERNS